MQNMLDDLPWINKDNETQSAAQYKIDSMLIGNGFSDMIFNNTQLDAYHEKLVFNSDDDFFEMKKKVRKFFFYQEYLLLLRNELDREVGNHAYDFNSYFMPDVCFRKLKIDIIKRLFTDKCH